LPFAAEMSDTIVSKADFARLVGVSAARVSQWLGNGMIGPEALLGNGRHARVRVELAKSMLRDRLDPDRSHLGGLQAPAGDRSGLTASKTRVVDLQRELLEIKLARVQGELIPRAAAMASSEALGRAVQRALRGIVVGWAEGNLALCIRMAV
jgi:phage terminase Nu1 subunit (DNA packaging protein)